MAKAKGGFVRVSLSILAVLTALSRARAESDPTYSALRNAQPDASRAVSVHDFSLERDVFRFRFESGTFQFLTPVGGRCFGAIFSGKATLELRPATENERRHLALLAGEKGLEVLTETFASAVFFFSDGTAAEIEKKGSPAAALPDALSIYQAALKKQKNSWKSNLQLRLLADALEGNPASSAFLALFTGKKYPSALLALDTKGLEWLFPGVGNENSALAVLEDSGPGLWYCSKAKSGEAGTGSRARALHYEINTTIRKNTEIEGTTTIRVLPLEEGVRVLPLRLLDRLRIRSASVSAGDEEAWSPLPFVEEAVKEDADAAVIFPAPLTRGKQLRLRIEYGGKEVLRDAGDGNFVVGARESWYPNLGSFGSPAQFDLYYRCPKSFEVVSVGSRVEDRTEADQRVFHYQQKRPVRVAGFNYGKFKKIERTDPDSGMTVSVYTNTGAPDFIRELNMALKDNDGGLTYVPVDVEGFADGAMVDGINTVRVGSLFFGPLPEKTLAITQQTQAFFGQSWPSLVYLPFIAALDGTVRHELGLQGASHFVDEVGPHEVAHQWWGHLVGWNNYRDLWLSEGFAEFSVSLILQVAAPKKFNPFWERARAAILDKPRGSVISNDSAGPIALGWRLATDRSPNAYQLVYSKGAYVLHMLRMAMKNYKDSQPDAKFTEMMKDYVAGWSDKNPSTKDFQTVVEHHMVPALDLEGNGKMDWFFRQWVDGTEIPHFVSKFEIAKAGEQYRIKGSVSQDGVSDNFRSLAHLYVEFPKGEISHLGIVNLVGKATVPIDATVKLPREPKRIVLNAMHDVLSRN